MNSHSDEFELKASDERKRLHESIHLLKRRVSESLDTKKLAQQHLLSACASAALVATIAGYLLSGMFVSHR